MQFSSTDTPLEGVIVGCTEQKGKADRSGLSCPSFFQLHLEDSLIFCDFDVAQLHATFGRYTAYV